MSTYTSYQLQAARAAAHQQVRTGTSEYGSIAAVEWTCSWMAGAVDGLKELGDPEAIAGFLYTLADSMALACATKAVPEALKGKKLDGGR